MTGRGVIREGNGVMEAGTLLAPVPLFEDFGCRAPWKYIKSSPPLAGALPENPTERVSFCFSLQSIWQNKSLSRKCGGAGLSGACEGPRPMGLGQSHSKEGGGCDKRPVGLRFGFCLVQLRQLGRGHWGEAHVTGCSQQSHLLRLQILPPQLINGASISLTIVFYN